jgi:hypothetical protein
MKAEIGIVFRIAMGRKLRHWGCDRRKQKVEGPRVVVASLDYPIQRQYRVGASISSHLWVGCPILYYSIRQKFC